MKSDDGADHVLSMLPLILSILGSVIPKDHVITTSMCGCTLRMAVVYLMLYVIMRASKGEEDTGDEVTHTVKKVSSMIPPLHLPLALITSERIPLEDVG